MDAVGIPRGGRELRAQAATPYRSGVPPDRDRVTLPIRGQTKHPVRTPSGT